MMRQARILADCIERLNDIVMITDAQVLDEAGPRIVFVNEAFVRLSGYSREEAVGRSPRFLQGPGTDPSAMRRIGAALRAAKPVRERILNYTKDGRELWLECEIAPVLDELGQTSHFVSIQRDISENRRADQLIAAQAALLDKAQDAILLRDLEHTIVYWNKSAERLYGWKREEAIGLKASVILDAVGWEEASRAVVTRGEWHGELTQRHRDGRELTVEARWTLIHDDQGNPKSVLAINTDITQKKKLETQFLRTQRLESIGRLAGGISHDLNNLLTPIRMAVDLLRVNASDEETLETLGIIETCVDRGANMVKQILSFSRGIEGNRVLVHPDHLLREVHKILCEAFPKSIEFHCSADADVWPILGDPTQLQQVLVNLCINARDALQDRGTLRITVENVTLDEHFAALNRQGKAGNYVVLIVADSGPGMSPEVQAQIFEPFFTTKASDLGTGLGLSTVLAIVKGHQGFINVYSEKGRGATFKVYLPAGTGSPQQTPEASVSQIPRGQGELILVVDDESSIRSITRRTLEAFGYRVVTARDGAEAVALFVKHQSDIGVVLTDMMMPVMDGLATIRALQSLDPQVRVIAASGLTTNGDLARAVGASVRHFLPKPYSAEDLLIVLHKILHDSQQ